MRSTIYGLGDFKFRYIIPAASSCWWGQGLLTIRRHICSHCSVLLCLLSWWMQYVSIWLIPKPYVGEFVITRSSKNVGYHLSLVHSSTNVNIWFTRTCTYTLCLLMITKEWSKLIFRSMTNFIVEANPCRSLRSDVQCRRRLLDC
jgi:hypothetical protein